MKTQIMLATILFALTAVASANCGNGNGNGNGCTDNGGTQGPAGPQGPSGTNGTNGTNGSNGTNGANGINGTNGTNGKNGKDTSYSFRGTDLALDAAVRLLDLKYLQLQAYDTYVLGSTPGSDVFGDGHNQTIGARIMIKLGKSYEERLLDQQQKEITALKQALHIR